MGPDQDQGHGLHEQAASVGCPAERSTAPGPRSAQEPGSASPGAPGAREASAGPPRTLWRIPTAVELRVGCSSSASRPAAPCSSQGGRRWPWRRPRQRPLMSALTPIRPEAGEGIPGTSRPEGRRCCATPLPTGREPTDGVSRPPPPGSTTAQAWHSPVTHRDKPARPARLPFPVVVGGGLPFQQLHNAFQRLHNAGGSTTSPGPALTRGRDAARRTLRLAWKRARTILPSAVADHNRSGA